jgi:hypothetical protein
MDAPTESIIAVIANPIAGNPSQLALERALQSMQLDWRIVSFDVAPTDVATAMDGFAVTGIDGVLIDPTLRSPATEWYRAKIDADSDPIDCLYRDLQSADKTQQFVGAFQQRDWLNEQIDLWLGDSKDEPQSIWFGQSLHERPINQRRFPDQAATPGDPSVIRNASLILLADEHGGLEEQDWPPNDGSTLVVDLSHAGFRVDHPHLATITSLGYRLITARDRKIGTLQRCLRQWTGRDPSIEVLSDAIDEYLAV